jgi:hypothetical protein
MYRKAAVCNRPSRPQTRHHVDAIHPVLRDLL